MKKSDLLQHCKLLEEIIVNLKHENTTLMKEKEDKTNAINRLEESATIVMQSSLLNL